MPAPTSIPEFLELTQKSGVVDENRLNAYVAQLRAAGACPPEPTKFAALMLRDGLLTLFQAEQLLAGKWKRFTVGKYRVLERIGSGGMGQVFLCEHKVMRRRVAIKVLPTAKSGEEDSSSLERFKREARAGAALDHPNIVRAYDIDEDDNLHFLVMEYVDGINFQDLVKRHGPMDPLRACHYIYQSALGLQHAFDVAGLVHRDIKPGNILVDRSGTVKILDMGLARFFHDEDDLLTKKYDESVLGTADYLAPEQAIDSHNVDGRADIYSLGATFYFMLTGYPPFTDGTVAQKLLWHQNREPKPIREHRANVPLEVVAIVQKMMAKLPKDRYQTPHELAEALAPFVAQPIPPPPEHEIPRLSLAATANPNIVGPGAGPQTRVLTPPSPRPLRSPATRSNPVSPSKTAVTGPATLPNAMPTPAPARPVAKIAPALIAPRSTPDEAGPVWTEIASETPNPKSHSDTTKSRPSYRAPTAGLSSRGFGPDTAKKPATTRWILIIIGLFAVVAITVGIAFATGVFRGKKPNTPAASGVDPNAARTLVVESGAAASATTFRTLHDAIAKAKNGDRILIRDETLRMPAYGILRTSFPKAVTIEADLPDGKYVTWKFAPASKLEDYVLNLENVEGLTFRRIAFDGDNQANFGLYIVGRCAAITFDDVRIVNCKECAARISNGYGQADKPLRFKKLQVSSVPGMRTAFDLFSSQPSLPTSGFLIVEDSCFVGPFQTFVNIQGPVREFSFSRNRCWNASKAVQVAKSEVPVSLDLKIQSNTFHTVAEKTLDFEAIPVGDNKTELTQNYFAACKGLVFSSDGKPIPKMILKSNFRDAASTDGNLKVDVAVANFTFPLDPRHDSDFLRYPKSASLAKLADGQPVGAPPVE